MTYFASTSGATTRHLGWFVCGTLVGFGWITVWQFVLLPFDPARSLLAAARSFYRRAGELVGSVAQCLDAHDDPEARPRFAGELHSQLERVRRSRRV